MPITEAVTTTPATTTPAAMAEKASLNLRPKMKAMAEPVHAPVTGRGTATKRVRARRPYFLCFSTCLLYVLEKSQEKKTWPGRYRISQRDTGSRYRSSGTTGVRFPATDMAYASRGDRPYTAIPTGIDPRSSKTGVIARMKVASQPGIEVNASIRSDPPVPPGSSSLPPR
ncbi:MAG: hypothetical protein A4E51_01519 [Methanosaeta sp. PtaU1.Bin055]|nr:MAG: hypothetical protein A4E51_01519 [Methanosaeta sp. PtaU1.Bin055]